MTIRFAEVSEEEVTILVNEGVPQKTKEVTSYAVKDFEGKKLLIGHTLFVSKLQCICESKDSQHENISLNLSIIMNKS